ncbi:MFS transporter [Polycladidibacter hongkongensis]|uniref:MFS transporter n=1 Tax=Polycladidibacter hongkongensis TaxID=1647556 RepID=UPI000831C51F|nr:MFS transporter [Pseudovibrio hongkongensis]
MAGLLGAVAALLLSVVLMILGHGLTSTLIPLAANNSGFSDVAIGLISSGFYAGYVAGCLAAPYLIMRAGHIRAFAALVSMMSAVALLHPVIIEPNAWAVMRLLTGFCLAGVTLIVESWLNERSTNENRGTTMSIYIVLYLGATMGGQVLMPVFDLASFTPFIVASVAVSMAVIPVALTRATQPAPIALVRFRPVRLYQTSPIALIGSLLTGMANSSVWMLAPLYASLSGYDTQQSAYLAAAVVLGGALMQWPIGRLSDQMDRRKVILTLAVAASVLAAVVKSYSFDSFWAFFALFVVLGAATQPIYAVIVAHAFDSADPEDYVETSSGLLLASGLGSMVGPLLASFLMRGLGPNGLFSWVMAVEIVLSAAVFVRLLANQPVESDDKTDFEIATVSGVGTAVMPEPLDVEDPNVIPPEEFPAYESEVGIASEEYSEPSPEAEEPEMGAEARVADNETQR